jgi:hypothetical protein
MSVLSVGFGDSASVDTGDITKSLRFRASGSTYMSRTFGTPTGANVWTWSGWVKRGALGASQTTTLLSTNTGTSFESVMFSTDQIFWICRNTAGTIYKQTYTTALYRDPSSWMHVQVRKTSSLTVDIYINGVIQAVTSGSAGSPASVEIMNNALAHRTGYDYFTALYADGYLSRICFVDGQALTPSSFGYQNTEINEWVTKTRSACKAVVDAGGTNSFMLDFEDGASLTTLGNDYSAKNNDWTLNNHSLTAGVTYDWMEDRPGNSYPVLNPLTNGATVSASCANANLQGTVTGNAASYSTVAAAGFISYGKWYFEAQRTTSNLSVIGFVKASTAQSPSTFGTHAGIGYRSNDGSKYVNGVNTAYGASFTSANVIGIAIDLDGGTCTFYKDNVSQGAIAITAGTEYALAVTSGDSSAITETWNFNLGQAPLHASATYHSAAGGYFRYAPPTGFKALCQQNLSEGAVRNPKKHFDVVTRSGTGAVVTKTGIAFQPDFLWAKARNAAFGHVLFDSVRGVSASSAPFLQSSATSAELDGNGTVANRLLTSFNADGYTYGADGFYLNANQNTTLYVDWLWKANGAAVSNTNGSITSQVSANVLAGFSIVTYTGTGANATVGHGLGVAPKFIIIKGRGTAYNWAAYHGSLTNLQRIFPNTTGAAASNATYWNSTSPTATTFSLGSEATANENLATYVAYCFTDVPGYQKIGSYTGNGSTDGPFCFTGFKPRYLLWKRSDAVGDWIVHDSARATYNADDTNLYPNLAGAESVGGGYPFDMTSNGFKVRNSATYANASGGTYIFLAIADTNGRYSNAR